MAARAKSGTRRASAAKSGSKPKSPAAAKSRAPAKKSSRGSPATDFSQDQELEAYREMLLIRRFEEKAGQMYGMGLIGGFCHLYIGQEAVVVGMQTAARTAIRSSPVIATTATCWRAAWTPRASWPS